MNQVTYTKDFSRISQIARGLFKHFYQKDSRIYIKVHFGEPGNNKTLKPADVRPIIEVLKDFKLKPTLIDTPVAYPSPRGTVKGYEKIVKEKGWNKLAPFIISDNYVEVKTKNLPAQVCKELVEAENVLVISHVKGHACSGFGGAIKNLGMGGVSKKTKGLEHGLSQPKFVRECKGCGICAELCPTKAISMKNGKAVLNNNICWGCSICQIECPHDCLAPQKAIFDDMLAQAASAVINNLPKKTFYINLIKNVTKYCDCEVEHGGIIANDIGALFSQNPVAIDTASIDLIRKQEGRKIFKELEHKDPLLHVNFAAKYTNLNSNYEISNFNSSVGL